MIPSKYTDMLQTLIRYLCYLHLVLLSITAYSQNQEKQTLFTRAGFKTGLNYTSISGDIDNPSARLRMHLGAVIEFPITSKFFIQAEVLYSAQGYTIEEAGIKNKININYLTLPIIAKIYVADKFSLETGPTFLNLSNVSNSIDDDSNEFFDSFENFDFGWNLGVGYKFESGMFFQLRYYFGFSNISNTEIIDITTKNLLGQVSIGYLFKTKNNRRQIYGEE